MPGRRKTFVTESGFYELAVAAPSMAAARRAWGFAHDPFRTGLARLTDDPAIVKAANQAPGMVLRRPLGGKGPFKREPDPPLVKAAPKPKKPRTDNKAAIGAAQRKLAAAEKRHALRRKQFEAEQERLDGQRRAEDERWRKEHAILAKSLSQAQAPH